MITHPDLPGLGLWLLDGAIRIELEPGGDEHPPAHGEHERWEALRAANPRLFNGPILSVRAIEPGAARVVCRRDRFRRLVAQPAAQPPEVRLLGVHGVVLGRDRDGHEHVLLARRGPETRVYGGMWELAPAGGVGAPPGNAPGLLAAHDLLESLRDEAREELGLDLPRGRAVALWRDDAACSDSVAILVRLDGVIDPRATLCARQDWEYMDSAWIGVADAPAFEARHARAIIPPTRMLLRMLASLAG